MVAILVRVGTSGNPGKILIKTGIPQPYLFINISETLIRQQETMAGIAHQVAPPAFHTGEGLL